MFDLRRVGFFAGLCVAAVFGVLALLGHPEALPRWWQVRWGVPQVTTTGTFKEEANDGARRHIYVGRQTSSASESGQLQFKELARREEAAWADARVDARAQYRARMAAIAIAGLILAILCIPWGERVIIRETRATRPLDNWLRRFSVRQSKRQTTPVAETPSSDPAPEMASESASPASAVVEAEPTSPAPVEPEVPVAPVPPSEAPTAPAVVTEPPAEKPAEESTAGSAAASRELVVRWTDRLANGDTFSHEMVASGTELSRANSAQIFFDLSGNALKSSKFQLGLDSPNPDAK